MANKRRLGKGYEDQAADYLREQGLFIKEKNYRCKFGEIDLIAQDKEYLVFVEVKYRRSLDNGYASEAVNHEKQRRISKAAALYLISHFHTIDIPCRFDVIGFDGNKKEWIKNAFNYCV